jgi:hydrogenase maturation protein HypF
VSVQARVDSRRRTRVRVEGTVQGVGFRPYVYRQAKRLGLAGYVLNDSRGVLLEIEGASDAVDEFLGRLPVDAPPLAVLERVVTEEQDPLGGAGFQILASHRAGTADAPVTPDSATCADCLRELYDPRDRRYRYAFINCTNCGPRFTIVRGVPYDRPLTTMAGFRMCPACQAEYEDPADRRFHAQPNACPACGPSLSVLAPDGSSAGAGDPLQAAVAAVASGSILALKGVGGYHLACRADDEQVVARLRGRKHREDRPFALMVSELDQAAGLVRLGEVESELMLLPARPIVLMPSLADAPVAASVAPGAPELGIMLPYSPLHHLLLGDLAGAGVSAIVLTSGNVSDEPIAFDDRDAQERLAAIADLFLVHDRPIETRTDDSVVRVVSLGGQRRSVSLRRSRGYVPASLRLPGTGTSAPLLACGAELKSTFCVARGRRAWVSHHIGDLQNFETLHSFEDGIDHFTKLFDVMPEVVAHDLHPEYLSTKYAFGLDGVRLVGVQHHHAHLAACLAEHGFDSTQAAVGAIFDGTGLGTDGTIWGGEFLVGGLRRFERVGKLLPVRLPGGERAIREPWRMACAWLAATLGEAVPELPAALRGRVEERTWRAVAGLVHSGLQAPVTTSMGRLFDGVAALCGLRAAVSYEGQAAIELEAACAGSTDSDPDSYPISISLGVDGFVLDPRETISGVLDDLSAGVEPGPIAARFHGAVAEGTVQGCCLAASQHGLDTVVLSGGVFQNRRLLEGVAERLRVAGLRVLVPSRLPVGDGGISFGQAAVAATAIEG